MKLICVIEALTSSLYNYKHIIFTAGDTFSPPHLDTVRLYYHNEGNEFLHTPLLCTKWGKGFIHVFIKISELHVITLEEKRQKKKSQKYRKCICWRALITY